MLRDHRYAVFPVLLGWYAVLTIAVTNVRAVGRVEGVTAALMLATAIGMLSWLLAGLLSREPDRRLLLAMTLAAWASGYGIAAEALRSAGLTSVAVFAVLIVAPTICLVLLLRVSSVMVSTSRVVRMATLILLGFPAIGAVTGLGSSGQRGTAAVEASRSSVASPNMPSVYFIVLDKYTGSRALLANYGFDNSPFEDRLRQRGFVVPRASRSNYPHTRLSLASMLNWSFVDEILSSSADHPTRALDAAIEDNRTVHFFWELGYEIVFFPTTFSATHTNRFADRILPESRRPRGVNVAAAWLESTPLPQLEALIDVARGRSVRSGRFPYPIETPGMITAKFDALTKLAEEPGQRFVFMHLLLPHEPYIFEEDCAPREPFWPASDDVPDRGPIRRAYIAQIQCLNRILESAVDALLARSTIEPIIILQADHGHGMMGMNPMRGAQLSLNRLAAAQVAERTEIFAAYHLPGGGNAAIYDSITPVNLFPAVLNHYFGEQLASQEDRVYWSRLHPPFELVRLD